MPNPEPRKLVDTQKLEIAVADLLIHEIPEEDGREDIVIANKIIRGLNKNTVATVKTQHGVENLHTRVSPLEDTVQTLVARNNLVDKYLEKMSACAEWLVEKVGWWVIKLIQLFMLGIAYLIVDYVFRHWLHTELPRSITSES